VQIRERVGEKLAHGIKQGCNDKKHKGWNWKAGLGLRDIK